MIKNLHRHVNHKNIHKSRVHRKTNHKPIAFLLLSVIFILLAFGYYGDKGLALYRKNNIIRLNQKDAVSGTLEKKDKNIYFVKGTLDSGGAGNPTTFSVLVDEKTENAAPSPVAIPYLLKLPESVVPKISLDQLKKGQQLKIEGYINLKVNPSFYAEKIRVIIPYSAVAATITEINGNVLTIEGTVFPIDYSKQDNQAAGTNKYFVTVTKNTEISKYLPATDVSKAEKILFSKLTPGMLIAVYSDSDVTINNRINTLRIQPINVDNLPGKR